MPGSWPALNHPIISPGAPGSSPPGELRYLFFSNNWIKERAPQAQDPDFQGQAN